ncbi:MAG: NAD-binding protein [Lachnospiraceae bacterium]|nr:NAD-binding protein [Lachnospiraceae bacterium]
MKIIIVGLGQTGTTLISALSRSKYDITVVDKDKARVERITDKYNVNGVTGSGASKGTLMAAGADTADVIVALTPVDEINLLSCMQAKALGTRRGGARLLLPDFVHEAESLKKQYNIDYFVKPKLDIAEEIYKNIGLNGAGAGRKEVKRIVIVGGGITGGYLMDMLSGDRKRVTILENDTSRCRELMEKYPSARVAYSGGEIIDVLEEENVSEADCLISLTDNDETNLVISMYAWSLNIPSIITRVDNPGHVKLLHKVSMDITVSTTELSALKMIRFIESLVGSEG